VAGTNLNWNQRQIELSPPDKRHSLNNTNQFGLNYNHAYTILSAHEIYDKVKNETYRLYKARNPWRTDGAYFGKWRDQDPNWTEDIKK
jgi:hypothetical protein